MKYGKTVTAGAILLGLCAILVTNKSHAEGVTIPDPAVEAIEKPAEPVSTDPRFPDANLERVVRNALEIPEGALTREALEGLTDLSAYYAGISDLTGIELLPNLQKADLQNNKIADLRPLTGLVQLENLYLTYNEVSDVSPLAALENLKRLNLSSNKLRDIAPLAHLASLEHLSLSSNRNVENISVIAGLSQLTGLYIGRMGLSDLAFVSNLKNLYTLSADSNAFTSLEPLRGLEKLKEIKLDGNQIADLSPISDFTEVWRLNLSENRIASIDGIPSLKSNARVELFQNQIADIRPLVKACGYTGEIVIDLGQNQLAAEAFCRDIPEMEARGNRVFFKYESPVNESRPFPDIKMLCAAADRTDAELVLAAVNRGATGEELHARFGLGTPPDRDPIAVAAVELPTPTPTVPTQPQAPAIELPEHPVAPTPKPAPTATAQPAPTPADGTSAALAVTLADTQFNVSLESTGLDLQSLLGGIVLLGVGVMLVIAWRMPRPQ